MRYTRLKSDFVDMSELHNLLDNTCWYSLPKQQTSDGPVDISSVPDCIVKAFNFQTPFITAGFVKVNSDYNLPAHEDNFLSDKILPYADQLSTFYIDWLKKTGTRKCSLMIPVTGDFSNTRTDLYWKATQEKFASFTLEAGPVLFQTQGDVLHGVDNTNKQERITFQLSFGEDYECVRDKISALGLTQV